MRKGNDDKVKKENEKEDKEIKQKQPIKKEIKEDKPPVKLDLIGFGSFDVPL